VGGFSSRAEAQRALQNKLARLLPGGRAAALTLGEWVEEYLDAHQGERVWIVAAPLPVVTSRQVDVMGLCPER
jgi:hypothetical protein